MGQPAACHERRGPGDVDLGHQHGAAAVGCDGDAGQVLRLRARAVGCAAEASRGAAGAGGAAQRAACSAGGEWQRRSGRGLRVLRSDARHVGGRFGQSDLRAHLQPGLVGLELPVVVEPKKALLVRDGACGRRLRVRCGACVATGRQPQVRRRLDSRGRGLNGVERHGRGAERVFRPSAVGWASRRGQAAFELHSVQLCVVLLVGGV